MDTEAIQKFLREERTIAGASPLQDARVNAVIERICASQRYPAAEIFPEWTRKTTV